MAYVNDDKCAEYGLDPRKVERIARRIARAMAEAKSLGLIMFGGSGTGMLRYAAGGESGNHTTVAVLGGTGYDGGDGGDE